MYPACYHNNRIEFHSALFSICSHLFKSVKTLLLGISFSVVVVVVAVIIVVGNINYKSHNLTIIRNNRTCTLVMMLMMQSHHSGISELSKSTHNIIERIVCALLIAHCCSHFAVAYTLAAGWLKTFSSHPLKIQMIMVMVSLYEFGMYGSHVLWVGDMQNAMQHTSEVNENRKVSDVFDMTMMVLLMWWQL